MFANYNYDNFPVVFVNFSENINSENDFDQFLNEWLILYHNRRYFSFIFDTRNMKNISIKYAIKMTLFNNLFILLSFTRIKLFCK